MQARFIVLLFIAALALTSASCSKERGSQAKPQQRTAAQPEGQGKGHAVKDIKPGSYEDWCGEHQVPESQCTRCNPDLIPAFKATNDWCAEHGLPESQCLKCNPDLKITRPPEEK